MCLRCSKSLCRILGRVLLFVGVRKVGGYVRYGVGGNLARYLLGLGKHEHNVVVSLVGVTICASQNLVSDSSTANKYLQFHLIFG